jgi:hypothetical protein
MRLLTHGQARGLVAASCHKFGSLDFFYSTRKTVHFDTFIKRFPEFSLTFEVHDVENGKLVREINTDTIDSEDTLIRTDKFYIDMKKDYPFDVFCIKVFGVE